MPKIQNLTAERRFATVSRLLFTVPLLAGLILSAPAYNQSSASQIAAQSPDMQAAFVLGFAKVAKDRAKAVRRDRTAARQGDVEAQARLGALYFAGWGGALQDDEEALKWLGQAARQNHARAQTYLGMLYAQGRGVERNPIVAQIWFDLAASQGDRLAQLVGPKNAAELSIGEIAQAAVRAREWRKAFAAGLAEPASGEDGVE